MNDPNSLASLPFDQITQSPVWQNSTVEDRVQITNKYYTDLAASMAGTDDDTDENRQKLATVRRAAIYEVAPFLKQPEDIGVMENVSNAFTKSMSSFHENITLNLLEQNPEEAARYHREMERIYPTREGFSEKVGRITGMMLPTGAALLSAPVTGPLGLTGAAAIATGALYGASSAGAALGDIYAYEQATGEDVSSGKTAAVMAGHAVAEMASEVIGIGKLLGIARRTGASIGSQTAQKLGEGVLAGSKTRTMQGMIDAVSDYFTHNRAARLSLGWVQMGAVEGIEEVASQIGQNFTDKLYRESPVLEGLMQTFEEGALGGLLLGPLAIGMEVGQASRVREAMYQQSKVLLNETLMAEARRQGGQDEVAVGQEYDRLSATMTPERVDRGAYENPDFMMLKEAFGMAGVELVPVLGTSESKGKGVRYVAKDGTPVAVVDMNRVRGNAAVLEFAASHELFHGLETVLGKQGSIELARELAATIPEFSKYKATLDAAYHAQQLGETTQDYAVSEITADIFGQAFFKPQFQRAAIKIAAANPAIGRETVARLKDMRSRFERMGRRVDAYLAMTPEAQAAAGNVIQLPNVAMQAAKAKINETTTYLDRITGDFVKGFGEALALKEKTEAQAKVQGDEGEEDLVTGEKVAPLSVNEGMTPDQMTPMQRKEAGWLGPVYHGSPDFKGDTFSREYLGRGTGVSRGGFSFAFDRAAAEAYANEPVDSFQPKVDAANAVMRKAVEFMQSGGAIQGFEDWSELPEFNARHVDDPEGFTSYLQELASVLPSGLREEMQAAAGAGAAVPNRRVITAYVKNPRVVDVHGKKAIVAETPEQIFIAPEAPLSIIESITPEEIFARAFDAKNTQFRKSPEGEALRAVWNNSTRTSWVLDKVFGQTRFSAPPASQDQSSAAYRLRKAYDALPAWAKSEDGVEWGRTDFFSKFGKLLGVSGVDPNETALGYLQDQALTPDENATGTNEDHVLENLAGLVREHKTKGDFRKAVGAMAQEELKPHLQDLSRRKVSKEIERLRITRQTAFDVPAATIQRVADMDFKNPLMQRLVSRDDLRAGDVVLQKGTLYWIRGFDADGSPEALVMRGQEKPFDDSPAALDDPNQDPEIAKDYRFGQEALPVTPYYGVELFFDPNWQENPDIMAMVDDAMIAAEKPLMPWEGEAPLSVNEGLRPRSVDYYGDVEIIRNPEPADYQAITAEYRREFPMDRSGDPTTRFTTDAAGNRWIWRSDAGIHSFIEPLITAREGVSVNQNAANFARRQANLSVVEGPNLYREMSAESALELHPMVRADSPFGVPDQFFATTPELALGQGMNKGVLLEFSGGFPSRPAPAKPGADLVSQMGGGEERTARIQPSELRKHLTGITVQKRAFGTRSELARLNKWMSQLESDGWTKTVGKDGSVTVRKPSDQAMAAEKPLMPWEGEAPMSIAEPGFYSKLEQVIQAKMPKAAPPQQVMAIIDPTKGSGVKAEEIKWSGVTQAVERIAGENGGKVPKAALLEYLADEGQVKFDEFLLSDETAGVAERPVQMQGAIEELPNGRFLVSAPGGTRESFPTREEAEASLVRTETRVVGNPKFGSYALPGGENYREVVLSMPGKGGTILGEPERVEVSESEIYKGDSRGDHVLRYPKGEEVLVLKGGGYYVFSDRSERTFAALREAENFLVPVNGIREDSDFTSSHFPDIPNYVAHMRLTDRDNGLFIEEIQSDRHQKGREKGYADPEQAKANQAEMAMLAEQEIVISERLVALKKLDHERGLGETEAAEYWRLRQESRDNAAKIIRLNKKDTGVPDAPFRKDWPLQIFKRALRDAVAAGKKWIGWTTGETQADRFDLSKQVESVDYMPESQQLRAWGLNGNAVIDEVVPPEKLADYVGKAVADKLLNSPTNTRTTPSGKRINGVTGVDLKIGGEGMKGFYDDILPKEIGKYVKQWGAKVEKGSVGGQDAGGGYEIGPEGVVPKGEASTPIWKVEITPEMRKSVAAGQPQFSINEELTQMQGTSAAMRNVWSQKKSYKEMAGRAQALLAGTADTYQAKLQKISLTPGDGLTGGAVRVFALRQLADEGIERALSKPMDYLRTYFGIDSRWTDEQAKRLMQAKLSDLELAMLSELSASGTTLGAAAYSSEGLPYSSHKNRLIGWFKTMMDMFGVSTAAKRDISGARAQEIRDGIHNEVTDTLAEMMDQFRTMPEGDFKPAIKGFVTQRIRERFFAKHGKKPKDPAAPMSVAEEAAGGELFDRIFADFGTYYRRLKSPMGDALRQEIAAAYGEEAVADMVASMETYAEVFPDDTAAAKPVDPTPAPVKVLVDDLVKNVGKKAQRALQAELAAIYKGEANDILREEYEQTIAPASLKRAAKVAVMTEEEQAKAIDDAVKALAAAVFKRLKNRQGGAQLVKDGMLTEESVLRDLQPLKDKMLDAEMPMNVLKGAVNEIMRQANVTISDMLKLNSETFGQVSAGIAADVAGALKAKLAATPALEAFPDVVEAAAAKAGAAVERMLRKRLEDRIETMENTAMVDWNFIQRQGRAFVAPFVDVVMQGAKPFRDTAKGAASIILGDQAAWRARVGESLRAASAKAVMLNPAEDILLPFRTGLGLPETATMEDVEAALLAVKLPPTIARRVVVEHLAQTERSLADMATSLEPERVQAQVVQELVAEFGPDSADVWVPAVRDLVAERTAIIKKRLAQPKTRKAGQRQDVLDRLLFAAASGSFDDAALMDFIAEQAGMPPMSPETKAKLQVLVQKELDAIIETKDPGSVNVKPFTMEISTLLAKEVMESWPKGTFTKKSVLRIINAFYASALSGFKTWMVTNPLGSELKLLFTMSEMTLRNALLDPTLKKAGFRGTLSAWSHMLKSFSLAPVKAALFDAVVPGRINRKLSLGGSYVDAGLFDVSQDLGWLSKAHPDVAKNIGAVTNWVYGNLAKYVPRLIWSGDVTQYHRGNEFGAFEKARKEVMEEHPDWSHNQVIDAVYDRLGVTPFGKPKEKFIEAARIESEKLFGPGQPEYRILNRAFEMARAARGDTLFAAGDFAGAQSTFTGTIGVGYAEIEGAYVPQGKDTSLLEKGVRVLEEAKQSDNPFLSLGATALVPFTSIASKIMDATFTYTLFPGIIRYREMVGLAANEENERLRKNYEEGAQLQLVRMVNGTLVTAAMILLAAASRDEEDPWFKITGAGPKDFRKNWQWREAGNRPFTLTIFGKNGVQIDFRTHPLYAFLAAVGTWSDQMNEDPDDRAGLVSAWSSGFLSSLQNQSFMSSIADLMGAISGRDEAAGQQKLMSLFINPALTAAVPASGALRQIEETFFPYPNASRIEDNFFMTFVRTALARLPVANGILPRKVNALGRDIESDRPMETTVGLAGWKRGSDDDAAKVFDWAVAKQAWIPTPSVFQTRLAPPEDAMTVGERRQIAPEREAMMTFDQYTEFLKRRGDIIIATFQKYEPELAKLPAGDGAKALMSEIASRASIQAKREMRGWRPFKPGVEPMDRVIREKVREALKSSPQP